jgi:hypothetical protein
MSYLIVLLLCFICNSLVILVMLFIYHLADAVEYSMLSYVMSWCYIPLSVNVYFI